MKLSIIMPCYNVEKTIIRALDSITMQRVNFQYEILVVDDASTDKTVAIVQNYILRHPQVRLLHNQENCGNAKTFYHGLCNAKGDYFCVLDGDDYYTIPDKLQRQVDFLDGDSHEEYVAVATQYIFDLGNNKISIPERSTKKEFSYTDFLTQNSGYFHTSTYMYRNIFRDNVPDFFSMTLYRGDTPRTTFHLMYSNKKVRILDFVGSAYYFDLNGIWSSLKEKQQFEYQINYQTKHKENVQTDFERAAADRLIAFNKQKLLSASEETRKYPEVTIDEALENLGKTVNIFAFNNKDFVLQSVYSSDYIDTLCASIGTIYQVNNPDSCQKIATENRLAIVIGILNMWGGGIFSEIDELIQIYKDYQISVFVTKMDTVPEPERNRLESHGNVSVVVPPKDLSNGRLAWLYSQIKEFSPFRTYYYCSHNDVFGPALMQSGTWENICLFSFDHGYICGIGNPRLDNIIAKRPVDYFMLEKKFGKKVLYIPTWSKGAVGCDALSYHPLSSHTALITACGAARYYKVDGRPPLRYIDCVISLLEKTGGRHYHFGPLPDSVLAEIHNALEQRNLPSDSFVHIPWSDNIPLDLLKNQVDIFIEPFPVVSYKLTLEVLAVGIPVISYKGLRRMSIVDFVPENAPTWRSPDELIQILSGLSEQDLMQLSESAVSYFRSTHSYDAITSRLIQNQGLIPSKRTCTDNTIGDIMDSLRLFGNSTKMLINGSLSYGSYAPPPKTVAPKAKAHLAPTAVPNNTATIQCSDAEKMVSQLYASFSYRIGTVLLYVPRSIKYFLKRSKEIGRKETIHEMRCCDYLKVTATTPELTVALIQRSATYRVGRMATWLPRKILSAYQTVCRALSQQQKKRITPYRLYSEIVHTQSILKYHIREATSLIRTKNDYLVDQNAELKAAIRELTDNQNAMAAQMKEYQDMIILNTQGLQTETSSSMADVQETLGKIHAVATNNHQLLVSARQTGSEQLWATVFNNTIQGCSWLKDISLSPGRWAVGYPLLYVLYRTLDLINPTNILEMGLGQSSKLIAQYTASTPNADHTVIEQSPEWIQFFEKSNTLSPKSTICQLDCEITEYKGSVQVRTYKGLEAVVSNKQYDLIVVDGPSAEGMDQFSRIDILKMIPHNLSKQFVIILDDCNRKAEENTAKEISQMLTQNGIPFSEGSYQGAKKFCIWVSNDYKFLLTL